MEPVEPVERRARPGGWLPVALGIVLVVMGLALAAGGARLVSLGGSWYYVVAGVALALAGVLYALRRPLASLLFFAVLVATIVWAIGEVGMSFWGLVPRLAGLVVLGILAALAARSMRPGAPWPLPVAALLAVVLVGGAIAAFQPHGTIRSSLAPGPLATAPPAVADAASSANRWTYYGREADSTRYAPFEQINTGNVGQLEVAWTYRTGAATTGADEDQNTPIQVGDFVYLCTPQNKVIALDAETGTERWTFDPKAGDSKAWNRCRGVAWYDAPAEARTPDGKCARRVIATAKNGKLYALDAQTGERCASFGSDGEVDLSVGLGPYPDYYYMPTSQPLVAGDRIRPQDRRARLGLRPRQPAITRLPPEGQTYTKGTPNYWSSGAYDAQLNLVYLPLGNATPDFWAGPRSERANAYATSATRSRRPSRGRRACRRSRR